MLGRPFTLAAALIIVVGAAGVLASGVHHAASPAPRHRDSDSTPTFAAPVRYLVERGASGLVLADVTGDGTPDIVVADDYSSDVSVLPGDPDGDGTFGRAESYAVSAHPESVAVADLNGDGRADIVTANHRNGGSVLLGTASGGFRRGRDFATGGNAWSVAVGDLNGDGIPDLVVSDYGNLGHAPDNRPAGVSILFGRGDGSFGPRFALAAGRHSAAWVTLADFNGDRRPDIATADYDGAVSVFLSLPGGGMAPPVSYPVDIRASFIAAARMNGDRQLDLVTANGATGTGSVLHGRPDGSFSPSQSYECCADQAFGAHWVTAADLNGDGVSDLVFSSFDYTNLAVLVGRRGGGFVPSHRFPAQERGGNGDGIAALDLNHDGRIDLVRSVSGTRTVDVLINTTNAP
jgi:hypothetical protein